MPTPHPGRYSAHAFVKACRIRPAEGGEAIPFGIWPFQDEALDEFITRDRLIVLKARQLGLSWLALAFALWLATTHRGQTIPILNRGLLPAVELLDRVRYMHDRLPDELKVPLTTDRFDMLEWESTDSRILSLPATEDAGSGLTATLVIMDEWAKIATAEATYTAVMPTLAAGGRFIGISTARGAHNHFAKEWRRAMSGESRLYPIFIPWYAHPDRDRRWYERKRREFTTERALNQEFPGAWRDAFVMPEGTVFGDEFDAARHVRAYPRDKRAGWPTWRGVDFGYHRSPVYWAEIPLGDVLHVFAELDARRMTTKDLARAIVERDRELGVDTGSTPAGVDPAGVAQTAQATESDHTVLRAAGIAIRDERVAPSDRVDLIKRLLRDDKIIIDPSCTELIYALETAEWDTTGRDGPPKETYRKDGETEHPLDALGYLVVNAFPEHGQVAGAAAATSATALGSTYSPSAYG